MIKKMIFLTKISSVNMGRTLPILVYIKKINLSEATMI